MVRSSSATMATAPMSLSHANNNKSDAGTAHYESLHPDAGRDTEPEPTVKDCCDCRGPCVYPQGRRAARAVLLAVCATVFAIAGVGGCNFLTVAGTDWGFLWRKELPAEAAGLSSRRLHCTGFSGDERAAMDADYKVGRVFAYFTIVLLILSVAPVLALSCATVDGMSLKLLAACFLLATLFQGLAFVSFASGICDQVPCQLSFGAGLTVAGMLFCTLTAWSLLRIRPFSRLTERERATTEAPPSAAEPEKEDHSATHAFDEEDQVESEEGYETPMEATEDAVPGGSGDEGEPEEHSDK